MQKKYCDVNECNNIGNYCCKNCLLENNINFNLCFEHYTKEKCEKHYIEETCKNHEIIL